MIKSFARWLYMTTHYDEIVEVSRVIKLKQPLLPVVSEHGQTDAANQPEYKLGLFDAMNTLDLLVR